jgi:hypothetical protein
VRAWVQDARNRVVCGCEKRDHVNAGPRDIDRGLRSNESLSYRKAGLRTQTLLSWARPWLVRVFQTRRTLPPPATFFEKKLPFRLLQNMTTVFTSYLRCSHHFSGVHIVSAGSEPPDRSVYREEVPRVGTSEFEQKDHNQQG